MANLWRIAWLEVAHCNLVIITCSLQPRINPCIWKQTRHGREILAPEFVAHLKPHNKKLMYGMWKVGHPWNRTFNFASKFIFSVRYRTNYFSLNQSIASEKSEWCEKSQRPKGLSGTLFLWTRGCTIFSTIGGCVRSTRYSDSRLNTYFKRLTWRYCKRLACYCSKLYL